MPVYKDKNGTWYIKYQNKTKRGFSTKKEAEKHEAKMRLSNDLNNSSLTFDYVARDYLQYKKASVTTGTFNKYTKMYENIIATLFPIQTKMQDITKMTCRKFHEALGNSDYSTRTKNSVLIVFKAIFNHAITYFDIVNNPSSSLESYKKTYDEMLKSKDDEMHIWTVEEFERFINEVSIQSYKILYIVLYYTGMRIGEALALKWKDYSNQVFDIYKSITNKTDKGTFEEKQPKNANSIRKVTVCDNVASLIERYKEDEMQKPGFSESWYIFGRNKPLPHTSINRYKNNACKQAGVKCIRIHDFRHSHASYLISEGVNIVNVSKRLGHANVNTTLKVYTHLFKNDDSEIMEILDKSSQNLLTN